MVEHGLAPLENAYSQAGVVEVAQPRPTVPPTSVPTWHGRPSGGFFCFRSNCEPVASRGVCKRQEVALSPKGFTFAFNSVYECGSESLQI
jgi:hypothetical protein